LNINDFTRSAATSDAADVSVSKAVNFSDRDIVTASVFRRRHVEAEAKKESISNNKNNLRKTIIPPNKLVGQFYAFLSGPCLLCTFAEKSLGGLISRKDAKSAKHAKV
jgi:hypothetical protein